MIPGLTLTTYREVMVAGMSLTGRGPNKPHVDYLLSGMLTSTLCGTRRGDWHVYLAYDRYQVLSYIGQSGRLLARFAQHELAGRTGDPAFHCGDDWASIVALSCNSGVHAKAYERKLIHSFHPPGNRKCEQPACRFYLDGKQSVPVRRPEVNKRLREYGIEAGGR